MVAVEVVEVGVEVGEVGLEKEVHRVLQANATVNGLYIHAENSSVRILRASFPYHWLLDYMVEEVIESVQVHNQGRQSGPVRNRRTREGEVEAKDGVIFGLIEGEAVLTLQSE